MHTPTHPHTYIYIYIYIYRVNPYSLCTSGVTKRFAPSTMSLADGFPSGRRKSFQLEPLMAEGRPPAGMKASATTRLCICAHNNQEKGSGQKRRNSRAQALPPV